jgi:hypothetical protein
MIATQRQGRNAWTGLKAGLALAALFSLTAANPALAQQRSRQPAIQVDTRPLAALGARLEANRLQACLPGALSQTLGRWNGPPIIVSIRAVSLSGFAGLDRDSDGAFGGQTLDQIEGDIIIEGRRISLLAGSPAYDSLGGDVTLNTLQRIDALCYVFAGWVPSRLGLR